MFRCAARYEDQIKTLCLKYSMYKLSNIFCKLHELTVVHLLHIILIADSYDAYLYIHKSY